MEKQIFKQGDRVYTHGAGWGKVIDIGIMIVVQFDNDTITALEPAYLSFTEYTLNNFSQERPIDYNDYVGKWGLFWHHEETAKVIDRSVGYDKESPFPFRAESDTFKYFKPLTEEQIKILELE